MRSNNIASGNRFPGTTDLSADSDSPGAQSHAFKHPRKIGDAVAHKFIEAADFSA